MGYQYVTSDFPTDYPPELSDLLALPDPPGTRNAAPAGPRNGAQIAYEGSHPHHELYDADVGLLAPVGSPLDRLITVTRFTGVASRAQRRVPTTLRQFADEILGTRAADKARLPLLKLATFGDEATVKGALRHDANLRTIDGVEGDYDAGDLSVTAAAAMLRAAGLAALIHTTPSHTPTSPRWRVLCPTSAALSPDQREILCERLNGALGGVLAPESFTRSQAYYFGALEGRDADHTVTVIEGRAIDQGTDLQRIGRAAVAAEDIRPDTTADPEPADDDTDEITAADLLGPPDWPRIKSALEAIPAVQRDDRDLWLRIGAAVHHASRGDADGLAAWDEWSKAGAKYDARDSRRVWKSYGKRDGAKITIATLYDLAKRFGWSAKPVDDVTARLNRRHAIVAVRGRTLVTTERDDGSVDFGTPRDLHAYYENDRVPAAKDKFEPASQRWMRSPDRRTFDGVTFAPGGCGAATLNLWRGWAVDPDPTGSCALFLDHVRKVVCCGDAERARYVLGWLAHLVQRTDEKPGVGLVLRGGKGAGKDTVADYVARMIGRRHAPTVAESDHITGKFNARFESALLLHVQEGSWAGDKKAENVLKYLVTTDYVEIERKGIDSINVRNVTRMFISANAEWVVPASADERRWAVFEVSDSRRGDAAYFAALRSEMNGKGPAALLHFLRSYDLSGFDVRAAPETDGLRNQKLASLKNAERWWFETLSRGDLPSSGFDGEDWEDVPQIIAREALRGHYVEWMKARRFDGEAVDERDFGRRIRAMLPALEDRRPRQDGSRIRQYALPDLSVCRHAFDLWIGSPVEWEAER